jgi:acyl-CoA synthetase (AMP-forming)/AMP-acid ligase II
MTSPESHHLPFIPPPCDFTLTINAIYEWNEQRNPDYPMVRWYSQKNGIRERSWAKGVTAFKRLSRAIVSRLGSKAHSMGEVIGLLTNTSTSLRQLFFLLCMTASLDQLDYWTIMSGIQFAGYVPFAISPRNSKPAIEFLLKTTNVKCVVLSQNIASDIRDVSTELGVRYLFVEELVTASDYPEVSLPSLHNLTVEDPAVILHSSGQYFSAILLALRTDCEL